MLPRRLIDGVAVTATADPCVRPAHADDHTGWVNGSPGMDTESHTAQRRAPCSSRSSSFSSSSPWRCSSGEPWPVATSDVRQRFAERFGAALKSQTSGPVAGQP
jgi:hypothetical protein